MKVILLQDIQKVGKKYDIKEVASGYATNFLIPKKLAETATAKKEKGMEVKRAERKAEQKIQDDLLDKNIDALGKVSIEIREKTNDKGHLFKGIHKEEIVRALKEQAHIDLNPEHIVLEQPLKETGEFKIGVTTGDTKAKFTLTIASSTEKEAK